MNQVVQGNLRLGLDLVEFWDMTHGPSAIMILSYEHTCPFRHVLTHTLGIMTFSQHLKYIENSKQ